MGGAWKRRGVDFATSRLRSGFESRGGSLEKDGERGQEWARGVTDTGFGWRGKR